MRPLPCRFDHDFPHDYGNQDLRGRSFRGAALDSADFGGADLRGGDLTDASLVDADFTNARFGLRPLAGAILLASAMLVSAFAGRSLAYFMQSTRERLTSGGDWQDGLASVLMLIVMSKRTLKGDNRDRMLRDLSHRIVTRHDTRFTGADLTRATFGGNNLIAADMTGTVDKDTVWGPGQIPYRLDPPTRFFGDRPADAAGEAQGDGPITEFIFDAANSGDYSNASELASEDFVAYTNGHKIGGGPIPTDGPDLLTSILRSS